MFDQVHYDAANDVATIGAGAKWGDVYDQLDAYNVTVVGGRVSDVGVGGLILGSESTSYDYTAERLLIPQVDCHISLISMAWPATTWLILRWKSTLRLKQTMLIL